MEPACDAGAREIAQVETPANVPKLRTAAATTAAARATFLA